MGYYIETPGFNQGKLDIICKAHDGIPTSQPRSFTEVPEDKALICVINNGPFEAAGYCYNESEFLAFADPSDPRPKCWVLIDKEKAEKLTGRKK